MSNPVPSRPDGDAGPDSPSAPERSRRPDRDDGPRGTAAFLVLLRHQSLVVILIALVGALLIGAILIRYQGVNPWYAYRTIFSEALLTEGGLTRTLTKTTPLVLTGLAVVLPLRVGLFNIGGQGQLLLGAIAAAWAGYQTAHLGILAFFVAALVGVLFGAMVGSIAALLKTSRGVHEVITTIMLNNIAAGVVWWLVLGPFTGRSASGIPMTPPIGEGARIGAVGGIPLGFLIAAALAVLCAWMLDRTTMGFRLDTVGKNKHAAGYAGIPINRVILLSMAFAGGLAGLAGALEVQGVLHRFEPAIGGTLGFDGITIALLARVNPLWTIPAGFLIGILRTGAAGLQFATGIAPEVVDLLLAITLLLVSIPVLGQWIFRSRAQRVQLATTSWGN